MSIRSFICNHCQKSFHLSRRDGHRKFCSRSCSATYNNSKRGPKSQDTKAKISATVRKKLPIYSKVSWCKSCAGVIQNEWKTKCQKCRTRLSCDTKSSIPEDALTDVYPRLRHGIITHAARVLEKDRAQITYKDVEIFRNIIETHLNQDNLSPSQIAEKYQIKHSDFGMFIKKCLKLQLKNVKSAVKNTKVQLGNAKTDEKSIYYDECSFRLTQAELTLVPGFALLKSIGVYHSTKNPNGAVRDHILSRHDAWLNKYDPAHIRHPANCRFITNLENIKKSSSSDITYEELLNRIADWDKNTLPLLQTKRRKIPKSPEHIEKIRHAIKERYRKMDAGELPNLKRKSKKLL